ncbi:MAG: hypothetical protein Q4P33_01425 [Flaviflexus sp.]|nr:hypothetical protein [Flaviflexus sp.]
MIPHDDHRDWESKDPLGVDRLRRLVYYLVASLLAFNGVMAGMAFFAEGRIAGLFVSGMFLTWAWGFTVWAKHRRLGQPRGQKGPARRAAFIMLAAAAITAGVLLWQGH